MHRLARHIVHHALRLRNDSAQDTFEYVLVIGGVVVLVIAGLLAFDEVVSGVLGAVCPSVDTARGIAASAGSCVQ